MGVTGPIGVLANSFHDFFPLGLGFFLGLRVFKAVKGPGRTREVTAERESRIKSLSWFRSGKTSPVSTKWLKSLVSSFCLFWAKISLSLSKNPGSMGSMMVGMRFRGFLFFTGVPQKFRV